MNHWTKRLFALAAPLLLIGCLWGPGKFASDLTLKKDGSFVLDYRGELVLQLPSETPWKAESARCYEGVGNKHARAVDVTEPGQTLPKERPCTTEEIAAQKADFDGRLAKGRQGAEQMAKMFGLPGTDDASNRAFAAKLMKYAGWRSVTYRGNGVFSVDYHFVGDAKQDFLFPALPDNDLLVPFIAIRRRADGSVLVTAPALTGGAGPLAARLGGIPPNAKTEMVSRAQGRFTIVTDGEILTNNSEDGPKANAMGRELRWDVSPGSKKIPEALIRL
jgi:hypothetical protein